MTQKCAVTMIALLAATGCSKITPVTPVEASKPVAQETVAVAKPVKETLQQQVVLTGDFKPYQTVDLHAKVPGYLRKITVDVGDRVRAGQLIASLEVPEMASDISHANAEVSRQEAELKRLHSEVERAKANLGIAELSYKRLEAAAKAEKGIVAQQEIDEALAKRRAAEAQVASADAALGVVRHQIEASRATVEKAKTLAAYTEITAPFDGIVTKRNVDLGAMIQAGTSSSAVPLVRIAEIRRLRMVVIVPESAVPMVRPGTTVAISVPVLRKKFEGRVARLSNDVQFTSRTMEAEVDVANPSGELIPGMTAEVAITLARKEDGLTVPVTAISNNGGNRSVMVVNSGAIEEREIKTGMESAARIEVVTGISPEDLIVVGNRSLLRAGQRVETKLTEVN
ncbi:MAG: efflux RND transporter periplasmic adaptor subunit [Bryobacteraceae bacterium]